MDDVQLNRFNHHLYANIFTHTTGDVDISRCPIELKRQIHNVQNLHFKSLAAKICSFTQTGKAKLKSVSIYSSNKTRYNKEILNCLLEVTKYCRSNPT